MISLQTGLLVMLTLTPSKKRKKINPQSPQNPKETHTKKTNHHTTRNIHLRLHFYAKFISLLWLTFHFSCLWISQKHLSTKLTIPFSMTLTAHLIERQNHQNFLILCFRCTFTFLQWIQTRQVIIQLLKFIISFSKSILCEV